MGFGGESCESHRNQTKLCKTLRSRLLIWHFAMPGVAAKRFSTEPCEVARLATISGCLLGGGASRGDVLPELDGKLFRLLVRQLQSTVDDQAQLVCTGVLELNFLQGG
jgi:hypothetical protein